MFAAIASGYNAGGKPVLPARSVVPAPEAPAAAARFHLRCATKGEYLQGNGSGDPTPGPAWLCAVAKYFYRTARGAAPAGKNNTGGVLTVHAVDSSTHRHHRGLCGGHAIPAGVR